MSTALKTPPVAPATTTTDLRRITESDPDYQRLHATTTARLARSLKQYIREEQRGDQGADSRFIQRHVALMKQAYIAAHHEGQKDYWPAVSKRTVQHRFITPDEQQTQKRLTYYALGSVLKLAHQVKTYVQQGSLVESTAMEIIALAAPVTDLPGDYVNRVALQGQITWSGLQDGYSDAGGNDSATPYTQLYWNLGPVLTEHCDDCPDLAMGSPYDPPWAGAGSNQLDQTPGDGQTECGAACKCSLSYDSPSGDALNELGQAIQAKWNDWYPSGMDSEGNVLTQPISPPKAGTALTDEQKSALDNFRNSSDMWDTVRRQLPPMPSLFGTEDLPSPLPAWDELTAAQQAVVKRVEQAQEQWLNAAGKLVPAPVLLPDPATEMRKWLEQAGRGDFTPWWNEMEITPSQEDEIEAWLDAVARGDVVQWPTPQQPEEYDAMQKWLEWASEHLDQQKQDSEIQPFEGEEFEQPVIHLVNNYPRQAGGRFGFGPGTTSGGTGRRGRSSQASASNRPSRASTRMTDAERNARIGEAITNRDEAGNRVATARDKFNQAADKYHDANDKYQLEQGRLDIVTDNLKAGARAQIIEESQSRAPKTYEKYQQSKTTYEESKAKLDAMDIYGKGSPYATQQEIGKQANDQWEASHNGEKISSFRQYNQALQATGRMDEYQQAQDQIDESNRLANRMYNSERSMQRYENQLVGSREASSDFIQNNSDYISQKAITDEAKRAADDAKAEWASANSEMNAASADQSLYSRQADLLSRSGNGIVYDGDGQKAVSDVFGRDLSEEEIRQLAGASGDDIVTVGSYEDNQFGLNMQSVDGEREATFSVSRKGDQIIISDPVVRNRGEAQGAATDLVDSFDDMKDLGVTRLTATAARMAGGRQSGFNGYYTWARLGFTGKIPDSILPKAQSVFGSNVTRVEQIMRQGRTGWNWWKANGTSWTATFSFKDGSYSMRTLNAWRSATHRNS